MYVDVVVVAAAAAVVVVVVSVDSVYNPYRLVIASNSTQLSLSSFNIEGYIGVNLRYCGVGELFLRYFGNFNLEMRYRGIPLTYGMKFFIISDDIKSYPPSPSTFSAPFPVSD